MKERPILFSGPMVCAILEGRKTQTRRVIQLPSWTVADDVLYMDEEDPAWPHAISAHSGCMARVECPYGVAGDRLWVRETFQPLFADGVKYEDTDWQTGKGYAPRYIATDGRTEWMDQDDNLTDRCKPGIHMPRWASRITLEIAEVRVQRIREISLGDALSEGCCCSSSDNNPEDFKNLWNAINAKRGYGWDENPWVWALTFKRVA